MNDRQLFYRRRHLPDIRHKRFVRIQVDKKWRYYKNYHNALRMQNYELYEWLCVHEPGFSPAEVLRLMKMKPEVNNGEM